MKLNKWSALAVSIVATMSSVNASAQLVVSQLPAIADPFAQYSITGLSKFWISPMFANSSAKILSFQIVNPHTVASVDVELRCYRKGFGSKDAGVEVASLRQTATIGPRNTSGFVIEKPNGMTFWCGVSGTERFLADVSEITPTGGDAAGWPSVRIPLHRGVE